VIAELTAALAATQEVLVDTQPIFSFKDEVR
jgi:hypothetical protein